MPRREARPTLFTVSREFLPTRLDLEFIALAYDQLLPLTSSLSPNRSAPPSQDDGSPSSVTTGTISPEGVLS